MMKHVKTRFSALAALLLLALFGAGILSVLLSGAGIYRRLCQRSEETYSLRTCTQYLRNKVSQAPSPENISLAQWEGCDALQIREEIAGEVCLTRIYCFDGWLMEVFSTETGALSPEAGEKLLPLTVLSFQMEDGLLWIFLTDAKGKQAQLTVSLEVGL